MNWPRLQWWIAAAVAAATLMLYARRLDQAPKYLTVDELLIGLAAHQVSATGQDESGRVLPLYFQISPIAWYQPVAVYHEALWLRLLPFGMTALRMASVFVGAINVGLLYLVGRRLFDNHALALAASVLIALSPAHFIHSRMAMDYIYVLPAEIAWLLGLLVYEQQRSARALGLACLALGLGFYSYISAVILMPAFFVITCCLLRVMRAPRRDYVVAAAGFGVPLIAAGLWLIAHPTALGDTLMRYGLYDARRLSPLQSLRALFSAATLRDRLPQYWDYLGPGMLFLDAPAATLFTQRGFGMLLLPVFPLWLVGLYRIVVGPRLRIELVCLAGLVVVPIAAVLVNERYAVNRVLPLIPFVVLVATRGLQQLWSVSTAVARHRLRVAGTLVSLWLMMSVLRDFREFSAAYFEDYRRRSEELSPGNLPDVLDEVVALDREQPSPAIYLSAEIPDLVLYLKAANLQYPEAGLPAKTTLFPIGGLSDVSIRPGSLVLATDRDAVTQATHPSLSLVTERRSTTPNLKSFAIFRRAESR
jgi:hypothetical protein